MYSVVYFIYGNEFSGAEMVVINELKALSGKVDLYLICNPLFRNDFAKRIPECVKIVPVKLRTSPLYGLWSYRNYRLLYQHISNVKCNVLHCHNGIANTLGTIVSLLNPSIRLVLSEHNNLLNSNIKKVNQTGTRWYSKFSVFVIRAVRILLGFRVNVVIAVSSSVKSFVQKWLKINSDKIVILSNGIRTIDFPYSFRASTTYRKLYGIEDSDFLIGSVGRLTEQKGYNFILEAIPSVLKIYPNTIFVLAGDGPLKNKLKLEAQKHGIPDKKLIFLGNITCVKSFLSSIDLFVLPSLWEGLPISLLEAMSCGVPVIATDVDGSSDVITHGIDGFLVQSGSSSALSQKIIDFIQQREKSKAISLAAHKTILKKFDIEHRNKKLLSLLKVV